MRPVPLTEDLTWQLNGPKFQNNDLQVSCLGRIGLLHCKVRRPGIVNPVWVGQPDR